MEKNQEKVYIDALTEALKKKQKIMQNILSLTKDQQEILGGEKINTDELEQTFDIKGMYIEQLEEIDKGFEQIYRQVADSLKRKRHFYQSEIQKMQAMIRDISDLGMRIQALEGQNKPYFERYFAREKQEIKNFNVSSKTAASYYKNMTGQGIYGQSVYLNSQK